MYRDNKRKQCHETIKKTPKCYGIELKRKRNRKRKMQIVYVDS